MVDPAVDLTRGRTVHLVGVGGAGMSALAKLLAGRGHRVTGSDLRWSETLAGLEDLGVEVWAGHRPEAATTADLVVASSAVPDSDPELVAAATAGMPTWRRPQLLRAITTSTPTIGATGTHGKTSSTAMLVSAARGVGLDPSFVAGGDLVEYRTNAAVGSDDLLVLEVDEAFRTFEHVELRGLMVTNVEAEHLEHFGTMADLEDAFARVVSAVAGPRLVCSDDPGSTRLASRTGAHTYGVAEGSTWRMTDVATSPGRVRFRLSGPVAATVTVPRAGLHIARNAAGVVALLAELGHDPEAAAEGIAGYRGVRRRFERRGTVNGTTVVDDYAHHPTEVQATLAEAGAIAAGRLIAVFQPHLYSRTARFAADFGQALATADLVVVTDVYGSREDPVPGVNGVLVASEAAAAGAAEVVYVPHLADLAATVADAAHPGDVVVTMGAGDITTVVPDLLAELEARA